MATKLRATAQIGSWAIFGDVAGQMSELSDAPVMSLVGVAVARDVVASARKRLARGFEGKPEKWKTGRLAGLKQVTGLVVSSQFPVVVSHIHKGEPAHWARFFEQGRAFMAEAERKLGDRLPYLEVDATLRMHLLSSVVAKMVGRILAARNPWNRDKLTMLELEVVLDTDIPNPEARAWYTTWMEREWSQQSRVNSELNIRLKVTADFTTEQDEPLLLLPDYLAGVYLHADPRARLGSPIASPADSSTAVERFRRQHGRHLFEDTEDFNEEFPLDHDKDGNVVQRNTGRPGRWERRSDDYRSPGRTT
jgi:hypothetical protein